MLMTLVERDRLVLEPKNLPRICRQKDAPLLMSGALPIELHKHGHDPCGGSKYTAHGENKGCSGYIVNQSAILCIHVLMSTVESSQVEEDDGSDCEGDCHCLAFRCSLTLYPHSTISLKKKQLIVDCSFHYFHSHCVPLIPQLIHLLYLFYQFLA